MERLGVFGELGNGQGLELADELTQSPVSGEKGAEALGLLGAERSCDLTPFLLAHPGRIGTM